MPRSSLRSMKFCRSDFVEPRTKVHHIDKGYAYILEIRDFGEDPKEEISKNQRFRKIKDFGIGRFSTHVSTL